MTSRQPQTRDYCLNICRLGRYSTIQRVHHRHHRVRRPDIIHNTQQQHATRNTQHATWTRPVLTARPSPSPSSSSSSSPASGRTSARSSVVNGTCQTLELPILPPTPTPAPAKEALPFPKQLQHAVPQRRQRCNGPDLQVPYLQLQRAGN